MNRKRVLTLLISILTVLALIPLNAFAASAPSAADLKTAPVISKLEIHDDAEGFVWLEVTVQTPANVMNAIDYFENHELGYNQAGYIGQIDLQYSIDGGEWQETSISGSPNYNNDDPWNGVFETQYMDELHVDSEVKARARYSGADANGDSRYSDWSNMLTLNEKTDFQAHSWALAELAEAEKLDLIPDCLKGQDLTKDITRGEFAAVSVKVFEALTNTKAQPAAGDPFTDTKDAEILKAYNIGVTNGITATTFAPDKKLDRQTAATMLTRVYKKVNISGWTLAEDSKFTLSFPMPALFADDAKISGWARNSVYFMAANKIIGGKSNNLFWPRSTTSAEEAAGYAQATRDAALLMAVRMVKNLNQ